ncbi:MAG: response regulator transcription factor [Caldilineaceae bacterium]|nr:response regulator transcription factor [Caldilineaceae bacterium]MBP8107262.1 response regulator transcription factor [Caldilineaceae bacterium]MBP8122373.1 response regulator transcription factor [Caldilineaceae bacterium]MBP9071076.1 response regulator transcription factor [Caldilineaceae bacterium]
MLRSIVVADDRQPVRVELRRLLEQEMDLYLAGEANEIRYISELVQTLRPDILILNMRMLGSEPQATLEHLYALSRNTRVILTTSHHDDDNAQVALRNGIAAYVLRESCLQELVRAVRTVLSGYRFLGSPFYERAVESYISTKRCLSPDPYQMLDFEFQHFYT